MNTKVVSAGTILAGDTVIGFANQDPFPVGPLNVLYVSDHKRDRKVVGVRIHWEEKGVAPLIVLLGRELVVVDR